MAGELIYAFRVTRLPLLDFNGDVLGRIEDIVLAPGGRQHAPRVMGFVAASGRRRIFVNAARLANLDPEGARLRSWDVDLHPFTRRAGELLVGEDILERRVGGETVADLALRPVPGKVPGWEVARVVLSSRSPLRRRRASRIVDWDEVAELFRTTEAAAQAAALADLHPSDVAARIRSLPPAQRRQLADALDDERLADVLEELSESEQLRIIENLGRERLLSVLEEMEWDDATDLLAEMPGEQRSQVLAAMDDDDAAVFRRLLSYGEGTAGSLLTPDPVILGPQSRVAEALARIRDPDLPAAMAAQVFVTQAPFVAPTGTYLGIVHFQRLLREPPSMELLHCLDEQPTIAPDLPDEEVAERLAAYNLLAIGVADEAGRLLGAVTIDDVLDHALPAGWRQRRRVVPQ